jgi:hypothetical protein
MKIKDFLISINYQLSDSYKFEWDCYGCNCYCLSWDCELYSAILNYDSKNQFVYEMSLWIDQIVYRWIHPKYVKNYKKESKLRNLNHSIAFDNIKYKDVSSKTIIKKLKKTYEDSLQNYRRKQTVRS